MKNIAALVRAAFIARAQTDQLICNDADLFVIERASHFLAVTCNEGYGIPVIQKIDNGSDLRRFDMQLGSDLFGVGHGSDFIMREIDCLLHNEHNDCVINLLL